MFSEKKKEFEALRKENLKLSSHLAKAAKSCIVLEEFKEYKRRYFELKEAIINEMLALNEPDPLRYGFQMNSYVERLRSLRSILDDVNFDAQREVIEDEEAKT